MAINFTFEDHSDVVLHQLEANMEALGGDLTDEVVEMIQDKMLYGYGDPHGPDGHTEIVDTGKLFDSVGAEVTKSSQNTLTVTGGANTDYAKYVHEGTHKLKGRPFIRDALMDNQDQIQQMIVDRLKQGFHVERKKPLLSL